MITRIQNIKVKINREIIFLIVISLPIYYYYLFDLNNKVFQTIIYYSIWSIEKKLKIKNTFKFQFDMVIG